MPVTLKILGVECAYGATPVLHGVDFSVVKGSFTGIIGPNGSGKSTLMHCISRVLRPLRGTVLLDGNNLYNLHPGVVARKMAVVPQETAVNFAFSVAEVVMMGRSPHLHRFQLEGEKDYAVVSRMLALTDTLHLVDRPVTEISGGERQRVIIAKALAQEPEIILLDEPTAHLDISQQVAILGLLQRLNRELGLTVVGIFHDLNLAAEYCDSLILVQKGQVHAVGPPEMVLTAENIKAVYGAEVLVRQNPVTGRPAVMLAAGGGRPAVPRGRVHVVCGGGAGAALLGLLTRHGYLVSTGVLNIGDIDWEAARCLGLSLVEEAAFCPVSPERHQANLALIKQADACVMVNIPFGRGNLDNLAAVAQARAWGKPVLLVEEKVIEDRDFSGGQATVIYRDLVAKGALILRGEQAALTWLAQM
ncbi:MAG: ABC transporter ATP-binding protein [Heliobacteriaceae bacterium]|nr:ABC transporter ATP-binding protein [Heliobacteriaceae bacterium]